MFDRKISGCVLAVSPISGQRSHHHSVLEGDFADLDGLEKLGCGHRNASACFGGLLVLCCCCSTESTFIQQFTEVDDIAVCQNDGIAKMRTHCLIKPCFRSGKWGTGNPESGR